MRYTTFNGFSAFTVSMTSHNRSRTFRKLRYFCAVYRITWAYRIITWPLRAMARVASLVSLMGAAVALPALSASYV